MSGRFEIVMQACAYLQHTRIRDILCRLADTCAGWNVGLLGLAGDVGLNEDIYQAFYNYFTTR